MVLPYDGHTMMVLLAKAIVCKKRRGSRVPDKFDVAITVFAQAEGCDAGDAAYNAAAAIRQACSEGGMIHATFRDDRVPVRVVKVMETGAAAGNFYLCVAPTPKAFAVYPPMPEGE